MEETLPENGWDFPLDAAVLAGALSPPTSFLLPEPPLQLYHTPNPLSVARETSSLPHRSATCLGNSSTATIQYISRRSRH